MKKVLSFGLSLLLLLPLTVGAVAADAPKVTVTAETAKVYQSSSTESEVLATVKEGYAFSPVSQTKSFYKMQFQRKNDDTVYQGYILKMDTDQPDGVVLNETSTSSAGSTSSKSSSTSGTTSSGSGSASQDSTRSQGSTVYWVSGGKVYHVSRNCTTLKRSSNIRSGTRAESGKSSVCKVCG